MNSQDLVDELLYVFNILTGSGVVFHYSDENIEFKNITDIIEIDDETLLLQLDDEEEYRVELSDFKEYHVKENINLYDRDDVRNFDNILKELIG